jgi:glycosyltransferase involved in cell wall biosynthesis
MLLLVVPDARFFVTHRLALALAARAQGWDVHVATPPGQAVERIVAAGLPWHRVRFGALRRKPWSDLVTLLDLVALYRKLRPRLVHHVTFKAVLYGTIAARATAVPAVVNAMTGLGDVFAAQTRSDRAWMRIVVTLFRTFVRHRHMRVIVQNPDDRQALSAAGVVREEEIRLIRGSGVDPDFFVPVPRAEGVPVVLCVGRMVVPKGIGDYVEAARMLRTEGSEARFLLAGDLDPDSGAAIPAWQLEAWRTEGIVEFMGYREDARELYAMADIVCLPSYREGLPKTLLEAASCALPIVTTDVPGCREAVVDGENGFLVPVRDAAAVARALRVLLGDAALRRTMGERGRARVIAQFSLDAVLTQTLAVYAEVSAAVPGRAPASGA